MNSFLVIFLIATIHFVQSSASAEESPSPGTIGIDKKHGRPLPCSLSPAKQGAVVHLRRLCFLPLGMNITLVGASCMRKGLSAVPLFVFSSRYNRWGSGCLLLPVKVQAVLAIAAAISFLLFFTEMGKNGI